MAPVYRQGSWGLEASPPGFSVAVLGRGVHGILEFTLRGSDDELIMSVAGGRMYS